jgi:hypothetical protein
MYAANSVRGATPLLDSLPAKSLARWAPERPQLTEPRAGQRVVLECFSTRPLLNGLSRSAGLSGVPTMYQERREPEKPTTPVSAILVGERHRLDPDTPPT